MACRMGLCTCTVSYLSTYYVYVYIYIFDKRHCYTCVMYLCAMYPKRCHVSKWTHGNSSAGKPGRKSPESSDHPENSGSFFSPAHRKICISSWIYILLIVVGWSCWGCWLKLLGLLVEVVGLAKPLMNSICQKIWSTTSHQMMIGACTFVKCFAARWRSSCSTDFMIMKWGQGMFSNLNDPLRQIWNASERQCKNLAKRGTFSRCYSQLVNSYFCCLMFFLFHWREIPIKQA